MSCAWRSVTFFVLLVIIGVLAYRGTTAEDRARYVKTALAAAKELRVAAQKPRPEYDAFRYALRARTRYPLVTVAILAVNVALWVLMVRDNISTGGADALVAWGGSVGPRTTNGEWWRLVTAAFLQSSMLHLIVDVAIIWQVGSVLERLVGRFAVAAVYVSAGVFGSLVNLSARPVAVTVAAPAAVFGLYGLMIAAVAWQTFHLLVAPQTEADAELEPPVDILEQPIIVPLIAVKRIAICATLFLAYSAVNGFAHAAEFAGLLAGLAFGLIVAAHASDSTAPTRHVLFGLGASVAAAFACAVPLRNIADVKPAIAHVIATEELTASKYQSASDAFKKGRMTPEALARVAERTIVPELQAADAELQALKNVPAEHQPLVDEAREYLRLRTESWRVRAEAIRRTSTDLRHRPEQLGDPAWRLQAEARYRSNLAVMGKAEGAERAALEAFHKIKPAPRAS
jgi:membrane associated rhomboid family serine protease